MADYREFVQPIRSDDTYRAGVRVTYNGKVYESLIDNNAWSPYAYPSGWKLLGNVTDVESITTMRGLRIRTLKLTMRIPMRRR